ncbi:MAG: DUF1513 domain-containing protein [Spongiibacteraceae bacterium]|nr:DUF1513 domain-containing protein [Spongiibacteraceae bacterium]
MFSSDGRYLFTTENHYQTKNIEQSGIIAVYDTLDTDHNGFKRIDEYTCGGIGPHQLALLNDGHTLAIAMGGILTHPDKQRDKLNIDSMKPSLTYLDTRNGKILDQFYPTHHQMSIRHLAVSTTDQVIMGVQYQGDKHHHIPLVLSHQGEVQLQTLKANQSLWAQQNQYIASIAIDNKARYAISTSPRGGGVCLWDLCNLQNLAQHSIRDVAGALYSTDKQCFLVSNGTGQLMALSPNTKTFSAQAVFLNRTVRWDNHLSLAS